MRAGKAAWGSATRIEISGAWIARGAEMMVAAPMPALTATSPSALMNMARRRGGVRGRLTFRTIAGTSRSGRGWSGVMGDSESDTRPAHDSSKALKKL
jgi:hypothetical protein